MKKSLSFRLLAVLTTLVVSASALWAQNPTVVTTEDELVAAVLTDGANIQFGNDITGKTCDDCDECDH